MDMLMNLGAFRKSDLQNCLALLTIAEADGITDARFLRQRIQNHIDQQHRSTAVMAAKYRRRPDNITICKVCGKPAVIVPLARTDRTTDATHAIQCQNRPAADKPWRDGMCGHTEYIVRGVR